MQNKTTSIIKIALWLFILGIWTSPCWITRLTEAIETADSAFDYARITDIDYRAVVVDEPDSEGKIVITERLTFDVHAAFKGYGIWELWRDLPEDNIDGRPIYYKINSVTQILDDGTEVVWEESPRLYWEDEDYVNTNKELGPGKWYHSEGPYDEYERQYECLLFYVDNLYREEVVFEIEYEMYNATFKYNDCTDLFISLYSGESVNHLESYHAEILIPDEKMPASGNYVYSTYGTNNYCFPVEESGTANPGYHTFLIDLDKSDLKFRPHNEYIEFDMVTFGEDKHAFSEYTPDNWYTSDNVLQEIIDEQTEYTNSAIAFTFLKVLALIASVIISILILIYAFTAKWLMKKKHKIYQPTVAMDYYRDIPDDLDPKFASALVFSKHKTPKDDSGVYSAILLSLARKKYIELSEQTYNNDVQITIKKRLAPAPVQTTMNSTVNTNDMFYGASSVASAGAEAVTPEVQTANDTQYEPLTPCEEYYYNLLIRHTAGDTISMSTFQYRVSKDYSNTDTFVRNMDRSIVNIGVKDGYFQKADYTQPKKKLAGTSTFFMVCGIILITLFNLISYQTRMDLAYGSYFILGGAFIISALWLKKQSRDYILLTQFGEDEYAKWRGLYKFLNSDTLIHERTYIELPIWEKYLVYATAFGLSEKIIKAISINCPEVSSSEMLSNPCYRSRSFHHTSGRSFRSATRTASYTARSGGGGYGGGGGSFGYGGGGRGGGGGGGGH